MATDRRIYASQAVYVSSSPATGTQTISQLIRVQSFNHNASITRQNVNQFGQLAAISREIIEQPTVSADCNWLAVNANNESALGFVTDFSTSAFSGIIDGTTDDRNVYNLIAENDEDAVGNVSADNTYVVEGLGNCFLTNYTVRGQVGGLPEAAVTWEALNYKVDLDKSGESIPAVDPINGSGISTVTYSLPTAVSGIGHSALRPGDITISLTSAANSMTGLGVDVTDAKIQSYEITSNLSRENLNKLGSRFSYKKKVVFPAEITANLTMDVGDYQTGSLATILCDDNNYTLRVTLKKPTCVGVSGPTALIYELRNAKLDGQSSTQGIGGNKSVTMNFSSQVSNSSDVLNGFYLSGLVES